MPADLLELDVPRIAELLTGRKKIMTAANSLGRSTLRKQLGSGIGKKSAGRVIPKISSKQTSQSRRDMLTINYHLSSQIIFGTELSWQFLEILQEILNS